MGPGLLKLWQGEDQDICPGQAQRAGGYWALAGANFVHRFHLVQMGVGEVSQTIGSIASWLGIKETAELTGGVSEERAQWA